MVITTAIMGYECRHCVLSHVSLVFPRPLHLPLRTDIPLRDRRPLFVETQACPALGNAACMCASACRPLPAYLRPLHNVQEITGKKELNIMLTVHDKLLERPSNSLFTLSIMFSADKLFSMTEDCTDSVLSLWYTANGLCHCLLCFSTNHSQMCTV